MKNKNKKPNSETDGKIMVIGAKKWGNEKILVKEYELQILK